MDYDITSEDLKSVNIKRNTDAENQEIRGILSEWLNQDFPERKDTLVSFCWEGFKRVIEAVDKDPLPKEIDEKALSEAKNKLWGYIQNWLQNTNTDLPQFFASFIEYLLSSFAGLIQLSETGELSPRTSGGQVTELFLKKIIETEGIPSD